jgi:taurine dioxygenase
MVLVFPDQELGPEEHKAFARHFGRLHVHPQLRGAKMSHPEILPVHTNADTPFTAGDGWHADVTCEEIPLWGSMLYMRETPACGGGDTLYADMYLAYELLSAPMKRFLEGLSAIHDGTGPYSEQLEIGMGKPAQGEEYPRAEHPVVVRHPDTGRKLLYVNSGFTHHIVGLSKSESGALLDMLFRHIDSTPKLWCRVQWNPKTLTLWDNLCTQHHAIWDYYPNSRVGGRVSILGAKRPSA